MQPTGMYLSLLCSPVRLWSYHQNKNVCLIIHRLNSMTGEEILKQLTKIGIIPSTINYRDEQRIKLQFDNDHHLTKGVKQLNGRRWSTTLKAWHIPRNKQLREQLIELLDKDQVVISNSIEQSKITSKTNNDFEPEWIEDLRQIKLRA